MTELELLVDLHQNTNRQGPGSIEETERAVDLINFKDNIELMIADIGCGTGHSTFTLARRLKAHIHALDLSPLFLKRLNIAAKSLRLDDKITTYIGAMEQLPFAENTFDLIWSEGAIYIMGFERGIKYWRGFLKEEGYLAVSELSWITDTRPQEIEEYWKKHYPEIDTVVNKTRIIESNGYELLASFVLPSYCWIDAYYEPIQKEIPAFLERHGNSPMARGVVEEEKREFDMYKKFKDYYSYAFYIARKLSTDKT